jgi:cytochrome c-type biogenesis protein
MYDFGLSSLATAFVAGLLSVLSPCVMPLMPAYLSMVSGISVEEMRGADGADPKRTRRRVMRSALAFVLGFSAVFVLLGVSATWLGARLRTWHLEVFGWEFGIAQLAGLVIVVMGLHLAGVLQIPVLYREKRLDLPAPTGLLGATVVGAAFAFGWTPCVGPILGAILTLAGGRETVGQGAVMLSAYAAGLGVPFLAAAWSLDTFLLTFRRIRRHFRKLEIGAGALLVAVGLMVFTNQLTRLNTYFAFLEKWVLRLEERLL